jgi:hypothetical protein
MWSPRAALPKGRQNERKKTDILQEKMFLHQTNFNLLSQINTMKRRKVNWIGHMLHRNCLLKYLTEGKVEGRIEMTG